MDRPKVAKDIMVTKLVTLPPFMHVFDGIAHLLKHNISGAPVADGEGNYIGVFSEKCCMSVLTVSARLAEEEGGPDPPTLRAADFMATRLRTIRPDMDVCDAVSFLLKHKVSGAPVVETDGDFQGVFSEKRSMSVLIAVVVDRLPTNRVGAFMDKDFNRTIHEDASLLQVAQIFLDTPYRRLPVLRDGNLVGQISRRDVLRAEHHLSKFVQERERQLMDHSAQVERSDIPEPSHGRLESPWVTAFMDKRARTVDEQTDLLSMAQIFLNTPYRRLPVLRGDKLVGQVSRRDVLRATTDLLAVDRRPVSTPLYLDAWNKPEEPPLP